MWKCGGRQNCDLAQGNSFGFLAPRQVSGSRAVPPLCCIFNAIQSKFYFVAENAPYISFASEQKRAQKASVKSQRTVPDNESAHKEL